MSGDAESTAAIQRDLIEKCEVCGGPVDTNQPGHFKSPDERFRHARCHKKTDDCHDESEGETRHKRIAVDFDKTLTDPDGGTYFTEKETLPNEEMVEWVNEQYISGHTIIIWTSRPWAEAGRTAGKLTEWGVRWHGMVCEKGSADLYVDDKATTPDLVIDGDIDV